jgi:hypothetical protein
VARKFFWFRSTAACFSRYTDTFRRRLGTIERYHDGVDCPDRPRPPARQQDRPIYVPYPVCITIENPRLRYPAPPFQPYPIYDERDFRPRSHKDNDIASDLLSSGFHVSMMSDTPLCEMNVASGRDLRIYTHQAVAMKREISIPFPKSRHPPPPRYASSERPEQPSSHWRSPGLRFSYWGYDERDFESLALVKRQSPPRCIRLTNTYQPLLITIHHRDVWITRVMITMRDIYDHFYRTNST